MGKDIGINLLNPAGSVIGDFNNDGRMDLLVGQTNVRNAKLGSRVYLLKTPFLGMESAASRFIYMGKNLM